MTFRHAEPSDVEAIKNLLSTHEPPDRFTEIVHAALDARGDEYIAAVCVGDGMEMVAAYGMVAGTIGTASLYGVVPISNRVTGLLSFAAHDLESRGARQIVAEFPDTDKFKPYRDVLLESGYDPMGLVDDFYREGVAMVILRRTLTLSVLTLSRPRAD